LLHFFAFTLERGIYMHYFSYNENKQHGTNDFPAAYYYVDQEHPQYNMPFHWHKEWEIIRILQGSLSISVDGQEYLAKSGDVLLLREGALHGGVPQDCIYECFNFNLDSLYANVHSVRDFLRPFFRNKLLPTTFYQNYFPEIYSIIDSLLLPFRSFKDESLCRLHTLGNISRLFASLIEHHYYTENNSSVSDIASKIAQIKPVLEHVESHFSEPLSLNELSKIVGMNPKYFCRFFASITQQTPMNYVNYYRIEQASNLLLNSNASVTEVGLECGFNDIGHFVKTFKKHKGITPKQYQKNFS